VNLPGMIMAFLLPVGVMMVSWGGLPPEESRRAASAGLLALAVSVVTYVAAGFAFQFGGIWHVTHLDSLRALDQVWSLPDSTGGAWNVLGLAGFMLAGALGPDGLVLFLHQLPLVMTATLIPVLALTGRVHNLVLALVGLTVSLVVFPLAGHWVWSGGWLAALGLNLSLGHGYVDWAGAGPVYVAGGLLALVGLSVFAGQRTSSDGALRLPEAHLPLLAVVGGILFSLGWMAWTATDPFHPASASLNLPLAMANGLLAASAATLVTQLYSWAVTSHVDPLMAVRGWLAGWIVASAIAPFSATWSALALGVLAGIFVPLTMYVVDRVLHLDDTIAAVSVYGVPGLLGALAVGIMADGQWGAGWNGIGVKEYLAVTGQGVTGRMAASGLVADPGQLTAQLAGVGAIMVFTFLAGGGVMLVAHLAVQMWHRAGRGMAKDQVQMSPDEERVMNNP
jgi:Amt family ammonium transporter